MKKAMGPAVALALLFCLGILCPGAAGSAFKTGVTGASAKTLYLQPNQSFLINSSPRIKRVAVARPDIADVTVVTPNQLLVTGKAPGKTTLIYWSDQNLPTSVDLNVWADNGEVLADLQRITPGEKFEISGPADSLILTGTVSNEGAQTRLVESAKAYAKNVVNLLAVERLEQVLLQVKVAEVDRTVAKELGFSYLTEQNHIRGSLSPGNAFSPFFGNLRDTNPGDIGPNTSFGDAVNLFIAKPGMFPKFAGFVRALHDRGAMKVLAEPTLVVANGAEGKFLAGGEFPVVYNASANGGSATSVMYKEYGVKLNFLPKIARNGEIYLKIVQEVSDLDFANAVTLSGFRIPALRSRKAESSLQLADGQTFVLAGLIDNKISKQVSKIPLLGDIPILGALFRSTRFSNNETELMVMVTPKIVRPLTKDEIPPLPTEKMKPEETQPGLLR